GHSHPAFVERVKQQIDAIQHTTTIYLHPNFPLLAKRLAEKMPPGLDVTYFVNSGSEANDLAVLMARAFTGHNDVIGVLNGYHGGAPAALGPPPHYTWEFSPHPHPRGHHAGQPPP